MTVANAPSRETARKAAGLAADTIRRWILEGLLSPGQRLIEAELITQIPVSRSTLREAFLKLEGEGLVELRHQRGAFVKRMTRDAMSELFELRECLEGYAAGLAASRVAQGSHRAWLTAARRVWLDEDVLANEMTHMENNVPLHDGIVAMSGNTRLASALRQFELPGYRLQFLRLLDREQRAVSARQHVAVIDAILAGKAARAEKLMREHVRRAGQLALNIPGLD
jgi:DNA-binding GntR family transcriptional regulator